MKYRRLPHPGPLFLGLAVLAVLVQPATALAQEKKSSKSKAASSAKSNPGKAAAPTGKFDQHLTANLKLLNVLSRYADTLSSATDAASASTAVTQIETITKDAITAGEELVKLGRPTPEIEGKLAKNPDLEVTTRRVAEQTRTAVKALAGNPEAKAIVAPAIENFQSALNRIQQDADDPRGPGAHGKTKPAPSIPAGKPVAPQPEPAAPPRASEASSVPPPPH